MQHHDRLKCWAFASLLASSQIQAFTLWSTNETLGGTGEFLGPGPYKTQQPLFEMVLKRISFQTQSDFLVPFYNNAEASPNLCGEHDFIQPVDGLLSNGLRINENADMCLANIAGTDMLIAVVESGPLQGQQRFVFTDDGNILVTMNVAFDLGIGEKGVVHLPFYGTTDRLSIPYSLQTQLNIPGGADAAGAYESGSTLKGRIGDEDKDGWIDGTMVAVGNIPLDSPVFPGQPYAMIRHFELDLPTGGFVFGNVKAVKDQLADQPGNE